MQSLLYLTNLSNVTWRHTEIWNRPWASSRSESQSGLRAVMCDTWHVPKLRIGYRSSFRWLTVNKAGRGPLNNRSRTCSGRVEDVVGFRLKGIIKAHWATFTRSVWPTNCMRSFPFADSISYIREGLHTSQMVAGWSGIKLLPLMIAFGCPKVRIALLNKQIYSELAILVI